MNISEYFESLLNEMRGGADANTLALIEECALTFKGGEYQKAGVQLGVIAARTGKFHLLNKVIQDAHAYKNLPYAVEVKPPPAAPLPPAFIPLESAASGGVVYDCYLCKLENRESFHFEGMPPGYDHASRLPVCDEHADEPTSVRNSALLPPDADGRHACGRCRVEFNVYEPPPMLIENGREYNVQAHTRPSDFICPQCTLAICRELIRERDGA